MLVGRQRNKANSMAKKEERLTLPFIEKYKDKITHIPKEGPINTIIPDFHSLNQSKVVSRRTIDKENCPHPMNIRSSKMKSCDLKKGREKVLLTEEKEDALCIKLNSTGFHNMMKTLELPKLSSKAGKALDNCRYMMIVLKD